MSQSRQPVFRALADPTRREILNLLCAQDMSIAEVSDRFDMTRAAVKKHLTVLQSANLIRVQARGRERVNQIRPEGLRPVTDWLGAFDVFWDKRLSALKSAVENEETPDD